MKRNLISLSMIILLACSRVASLDVAGDASAQSPIKILTSTVSDTRGELVNAPEDMISMGVYCASTGQIMWSEETEFSKMENWQFILSDGDWLSDEGEEKWDYQTLNDRYTFLAYSPHDDDVQGLTSQIVDGELLLYFTVPQSSLDQPDLMIAQPQKDITPQIASGVLLSFSHALASVSFGVTSGVSETIVGVSIKGLVGDGTLVWNDGPKWSPGEEAEYSFEVDVASYSSSSDESVRITSDMGYLMMIPQELKSDAEVTVTLYGGETKSLVIPAGTEWVAGERYHYVIDQAEGDCEDEDDDAAPEPGNFIFTSDQIANCYIINPTVGQETIIEIPIEGRINDFWVNYTTSGKAKISSSDSTNDFAIDLVWHDFDEDFEFTGTLGYDENGSMVANFVVSDEFLNGNFVFAVSKFEEESDGSISKTAVWSWHLWFTDYNPDAIAAANKDKIVAGKDIAYKYGTYPGAVHRYADADNGQEKVWSGLYSEKFIMDRNIGQRSDTLTNKYEAGTVYYEFGRKDPFPGDYATFGNGATGISVRSKSDYTFANSVELHYNYIASTTTNIDNWSGETAARFPTCVWFDSTISLSSYNGEKSIFDPSPLGWMVPITATWSSFNDADGCDDISSVAEYFYYGYRDPYNDALPTAGGEACYIWSATPNTYQSASCLKFTPSCVCSPTEIAMTSGLPIRPIQQ